MICEGLRVIGLTGGIASGKSSIAAFFVQKGVTVIDADQLARDVVAAGTPPFNSIVALFGSSALNSDGTLNRSYVRGEIFADSDKRKQLEAIVHPGIRDLSLRLMNDAAQAGEKVVVYMAPLLIESGAMERVDEVWVVSVDPEIQRQRLMQRDGLTSDQAQRIIDSQMPLAEKERYADQLINNNGTLQKTLLELEKIWDREFKINHE